MFCGLGEEERIRLRKEKKGKREEKKKKKTHGGQKWVGRDETVS